MRTPGVMSEGERRRRADVALVAGGVAAVAAAAAYAAVTLSAGWGVRLAAVAVGLVAGLVARGVGGPLASRVASLMAVVAGGCVLLADVAIGAIGAGAAFAVVDLQTLAWGAAAAGAAYLVADGFDAIGVLTGDPGRRRVPAKEHLRGTIPCPACESLQTEPAATDPETGVLRGLVCNACGHAWTPGA